MQAQALPPRPLRLEILEEASIPSQEAGEMLGSFMFQGTAVHSLPNNISNQISQLCSSLTPINESKDRSQDE
ncbi:hypothetical protein DSO57_1036030 [Entomophthora muscae]|uniref:Uncharacterized protein n=1 Tax=Entomophthora muscae TaxID=34485 RepID=A0ACC2UJQ2_9FUNG|nr:hypothetical protein DSO57_1036030 [Entomophthora muscae]